MYTTNSCLHSGALLQWWQTSCNSPGRPADEPSAQYRHWRKSGLLCLSHRVGPLDCLQKGWTLLSSIVSVEQVLTAEVASSEKPWSSDKICMTRFPELNLKDEVFLLFTFVAACATCNGTETHPTFHLVNVKSRTPTRP